MLGVEVGEEFEFNAFLFDQPKKFIISEDGRIIARESGILRTDDIFYIINNPELITHTSRWTKQEEKDAQNILRCLRDAVTIRKYMNNVVWICREDGKEVARATENMFPSLRKGESIKLKDIRGDK